MYKCYIQDVGWCHLCGMIMVSVYGIIIQKQIMFDTIYIISFVSIPFSWVLCKDECIISYIIKKIENTNYMLGDEPENSKDIRDLFTNEQEYNNFCYANILFRLYSCLLVNERTTKINHFIFVPTCILYFFYHCDIMYKINLRKKIYPYFQIIFCVLLFAVIYNLKIWNNFVLPHRVLFPTF